ncbi:HAD-IA family hydrolase [Candidatus Kaiserbacteria bacterium]|nr:MAG: HAD-IA family hydrolase [Candidatus Kaiserbacteria bacterium]
MTYIFDFFGVISSNVANPWFTKHLPNYDITELRNNYIHDVDLGKIPFSVLIDELAKITNQSSEVTTKQWREMAIIDQEVITVIKRLKSLNPVALCSNAPSDLIRPILKENQLESLFDVIVISGEVGMVKPNNDIFRHTLSLLGVEANQVTFIDDSDINIDAASQLGMKCILYKKISDISSLS